MIEIYKSVLGYIYIGRLPSKIEKRSYIALLHYLPEAVAQPSN